MPALVAWIAAAIASVFSSQIGRWCVSLLVFLGLELGTQQVVVGPLITYMQGATSGLSGDAVQWLAFFNLDKYITCILSASATAGVGRVILRRRSIGTPA